MHPFFSELPEKSYWYVATVRALMFVIKRKWQEFYLESSDSCRRKRNPYVVVTPSPHPPPPFPPKQWKSRLKKLSILRKQIFVPREMCSVWLEMYTVLGSFSSLFLLCAQMQQSQCNPVETRCCSLLWSKGGGMARPTLLLFCQKSTQVPRGDTHLNALVNAAFLWCQQ